MIVRAPWSRPSFARPPSSPPASRSSPPAWTTSTPSTSRSPWAISIPPATSPTRRATRCTCCWRSFSPPPRAPDPADAARPLAFLSAIAQAALPLPLFLLFRRLGAEPRIAAAATALTLLNPVVWINGLRPMSDSVGLLFAVCAQAMLLAAADGRGLRASAALSGLAAGVRVQALALTAPLLAYAMSRPRAARRASAMVAFVAAVLAWAIPTVLESGGPSAYWQAFRGTAADAALVEPLVATWTLNRGGARRPARPAPALGSGMARHRDGAALRARRGGGVAPRGVDAAGRCSPSRPYLVAHALFQQAHTQRYALPVRPAPGPARGARASTRWPGPRAGARTPPSSGWRQRSRPRSARSRCPGVSAYGAADSPVYAAMREVGRIAAAGPGHVLSGHYMFSRFFALAPAGPARAAPASAPGDGGARRNRGSRATTGACSSWPSRAARISKPSIPRARVLRGRWAWPRAAAALLSGERPSSVDLVEMSPPRWFAGPGWGLSIEMARPDGAAEPARTAYLRAIADAGVVMIAGEPRDAGAGEWEGELTLAGRRLDARSCGAPWLAAYTVPPSAAAGYLPLVFTTARGDRPAARRLRCGGSPMAVPATPCSCAATGGTIPETTEDGRPFQWASREARVDDQRAADGRPAGRGGGGARPPHRTAGVDRDGVGRARAARCPRAGRSASSWTSRRARRGR